MKDFHKNHKYQPIATKALLVALIAFAVSPFCFAQVDRTSLAGTVLDSSGRALPDTSVTVSHPETGLERRTMSNAAGAYDVENLAPGTYKVSFKKEGFAELVYEHVEQAVGITRTLNPTLQIAAHSDQITVTAPITELDQSSASVSGNVSMQAVNDLPLNGKNWASLTALVPGAIDSGGSNQRTIRFSGLGRDEMNILLDGVDATGIVNQAQKAQIRLAIPTETIAEFHVDTMVAPTEYGDSVGAQIVVSSMSGTNSYHGSGFEYVRNSFFDARSPFDATPGPLPFRLNQFGSTLGGPIKKDKTFFFFAYEGIRQQLDSTQIAFVPSIAFRNQALATSPVMAPILNAYPISTVASSTANVDQYTGIGRQIANEDSAMLRIDQRFSDATSAFIRFNNDSSTTYAPLDLLLDQQEVITKPRNGVAEVSHVFSPTILDEFKFGFNQVIARTLNLSSQPDSVSIPNLSPLTGSSTSDQDGTTFSWLDNVNWTHGRHIVKAGVEVRKVQLNEGSSATTSLTFASMQNFQSNVLDSASVLATLPLVRMRKFQEFGYIQDEFKFKPNLTLNFGLRYQFFGVFHETQGRALPFDFLSCGPAGFCPPNSSFYNPKMDDFDPRLGIAWSPTATNGKTVIRAGAGIYHGDAQLDDQDFPTANTQPRYSLTRGASLPNLSLPLDPFLATATGVLSPKDLIRDRKDAYASNWTVSVEQDLPDSFVGTLAYAGNKGTDIMNRGYINVINPSTGTRPYPSFGQIEIRGDNGNTTFEALEASLQRHVVRDWLVAGTYMWSHSINDGSLGSGVEDDFPENTNCRACDKASSDQDARQTFSVYSLYDLPFGKSKRFLSNRGWLSQIVGGWQVNTIATGRTGLPVNVTVTRAASTLPDGNSTNQRPNLVPGASLTPVDGSTPTDWINLAAFTVPAPGTWGNAGRNIIRGPGLWQLDAAVSRHIALTERFAMEFRGECFNLFNRAQYGNPAASISSTSSFGLITSLANTTGPTGSGTPRQFQLALKFIF